ncbi:hypothetical protein M419DRAFT_119982 [Trichoderma reesei RUT C-30]|uniref:Uncharacterized protein n=1 Tax=Hypocrea jecorina (strain ATCC 56765 / BCRC 32924 / NRRL 11460 / Rut C-30) TaxID=1344414 RepID=A0A024S3X1_HYPJR|nr:hypothetical protein M419DRAFT_119982 [Trichoderma reesei RUT C-30]
MIVPRAFILRRIAPGGCPPCCASLLHMLRMTPRPASGPRMVLLSSPGRRAAAMHGTAGRRILFDESKL